MSWLKRNRGTSTAKSAARPAGRVPFQGPFPAGQPGDQFDVILISAGNKKIQVIKEIREYTRCGLKDAKDMVDAAAHRPVVITAGLPLSDANQLAAALTKAGATVTVTGPAAQDLA